jgi:hypothetical protein
MSDQSRPWYLGAAGNKPSGPFATEELVKRLRARTLDPQTICWREGMPQWVSLNRIEPFASAIEVGGARSKGAGDGNEAARAHTPLRKSIVIGLIGGGLVVLCAIAAVGAWLFGRSKAIEPAVQPQAQAGPNAQWGEPDRMPIRGDDGEIFTTFVGGPKDAFYVDRGEQKNGKKILVVVYYYKNVGPRERAFFIGRNPVHPEVGLAIKPEIKTDTGHIYPGHEVSVAPMLGWKEGTFLERSHALSFVPKHDLSAWRPIETSKVGERGESALVFEIPQEETPIEVLLTKWYWKLPHGPFPSTKYVAAWGFLPIPLEKGVPGLIEALEDPETSDEALRLLASLESKGKAAVPALKKHLAHPLYFTTDELRAAIRAIDPEESSRIEKKLKQEEEQRQKVHADRERERQAAEQSDREEGRRKFEEQRSQNQQIREERAQERRREASLIWRDKETRARFQIQENEDALQIKSQESDSLVRSVAGTLARKAPGDKLFRGTLQVKFTDEAKETPIRTSAEQVGPDQIDLHLQNWPRNNRGKKSATTRSVHRTLIRQTAPLASPPLRGLPRSPTKTRPRR